MGLSRPGRGSTILFVLNYPPGTGYAWTTIQEVVRGVAARLAEDGLRPYACVPTPAGGAPTDPIADALETIWFDYGANGSANGIGAFLRLLRRHRVRILYMTDQATMSWRYPLYRLAGVRTIVVHDRTSGQRSPRSRLLQAAKQLLHRVPALGADLCIGVSQFVVNRLVTINRVPRARTACVYNGIDLARFAGPHGTVLAQVLGLRPESRLVFTSGRAMAYKGIPVLLEAAAVIEGAGPGYEDVHLAYAGDGPALGEFRSHCRRLGLRRFHFLGRRDDTPALLKSSTVAAIPSVWAEAFGLTVVEAMAAGKPLVASRVGGIPELVLHEETGLLVPPGDATLLAQAIRRCLDAPDWARAMGERARATARERFSLDRVVTEIAGLLRRFYAPDDGSSPERP